MTFDERYKSQNKPPSWLQMWGKTSVKLLENLKNFQQFIGSRFLSIGRDRIADGSSWPIRALHKHPPIRLHSSRNRKFHWFFDIVLETSILTYLEYRRFSAETSAFSELKNDPDVYSGGRRREPRDLSIWKHLYMSNKNCWTETNKLLETIFR